MERKLSKPPKMRKIEMSSAKDQKEEMIAPYDDRPSIYFTEKQLPEIESWKVGEKYKLVLEVEMIGFSKRKRKEENDNTSADFKIAAVGVHK